MMKRRIEILTLFLMVILPLPASASYDYKLDSKEVKMGQFESEISEKLSRGATNIVFGWTEVLRTPVEMGEGPQNSKFKAFAVGVPYGIFRFIGRTVVGFYEVATCYAPQPPIFAPLQGDVV